MNTIEPSPTPPAPWTASVGDGTYRNPILHADYSDPDAIRVGDDYWLTASSFSHVPGLPILHSKDLVNWTIVNHALPALVPAGHYAVPRHGGGVWAPAIRHHAGKFWIYYPDPDFGIYVVTAEDPRGAWSAPVLVKAGSGLIDPCPFWDDDGRAYLIHAWAHSRAGISNLLTMHRLAADGLSTTDAGQVVIDANLLTYWRVLEGPKLYKRSPYYYIFAPAGGVGEGYQGVFRSRNLFGPYEGRVVLEQGTTSVNGPHQGAWVDTPGGEHWFLHFQEMPAYGRVVHLQPIKWRDGWPMMGHPICDGQRGMPVMAHRLPQLPPQPVAAPATSDEFDGPELGLQWQWQANPRPEWHALGAVPGSLRLHCVPMPAGGTCWAAPHLLLQKFPAPAFTATTEMRFQPLEEGESAGLIVFGGGYAWLGLRRTARAVQLILAVCKRADRAAAEQRVAMLPLAVDVVHLRVEVAEGARCRFAYSLDGVEFTPLGAEFRARSGRWVGAKVGIFASARPDSLEAGHADFSWFRVGAGP